MTPARWGFRRRPATTTAGPDDGDASLVAGALFRCRPEPPFAFVRRAGRLWPADVAVPALLDWVRRDHRDAVTDECLRAIAEDTDGTVAFPPAVSGMPRLAVRVRAVRGDRGEALLAGYLEPAQAPRDVRDVEALLARSAEQIEEAVFIVDAAGALLSANRAGRALLSPTPDAARSVVEALWPAGDDRVRPTREAVLAGLQTPAVTRGEGLIAAGATAPRAVRLTLVPVDADATGAPRFILTLTGLDDARATTVDAPDDMRGRAGFSRALTDAIAPAGRELRALTVLVVHLPVLRDVAAAFGPAETEPLLAQAAARASSCLPDCLALECLDEASLGILLDGALDEHEAEPGALRALVETLARPLTPAPSPGGGELFPDPAIGVAVYPDHGQNGGSLLCRAQEAAREAAREVAAAPTRHWRFFRAADTETVRDRLADHALVRRGLAEGAFRWRYIARFRLGTGRLIGVRQVVFWDHPEWGSVPAAAHLDANELAALGAAYDQERLAAACRDWQTWQADGFQPGCITVPLTVATLAAPGFPRRLRALLGRHRMPMDHLELELPAADGLGAQGLLQHNLAALREYGVDCALAGPEHGGVDLQALSALPVAALRLGEGLTGRCLADEASGALLRAMTLFSRGLGLRLIVSGVREGETLRFLLRQAVEEFEDGPETGALEAASMARRFPGGFGPSGVPEPAGAEADRPTLLVVDDDPQILRALQRELRGGPWRVIACERAGEALRVLAEDTVAVVLSDERMPGLTGLAFLARVRERHPAVVRMIMSAHADPARLRAAVDDGLVARVVGKPWDRGQLRGWLKDAVVRGGDTAMAVADAGRGSDGPDTPPLETSAGGLVTPGAGAAGGSSGT